MSISSVKSGATGISLALDNNFMEPIATTLVGSGGANTVTFNDIPQTYKHLQIRWIARNNRASTSDTMGLQFNSDVSSANYIWLHYVYGNNGSVGAAGYGTGTAGNIYFGECTSATATGSIFAVGICDILDYTNTNKYKVVRELNGKEADALNQGFIALASGAWLNTNAINSINIFSNNGNFVQYTRFSLYGIKG